MCGCFLVGLKLAHILLPREISRGEPCEGCRKEKDSKARCLGFFARVLTDTISSRVPELLETNWSAKNLAAAFKETIDSICEQALHKIMTATITAYFEELIDRLQFPTVEFMSDFAIGASQAMIGKHDLEHEAAKSELISVERQHKFQVSAWRE